MKNFLIALTVLILTFTVLPTASWAYPAGGDGAKNPVLWADVPDPSILRVGDTYYMISPTAHFNPGLAVMKSRDLVNWQIVGYAYDTLGDSDALALRNNKKDYQRASWGSSLRLHNGTYFVSTFVSAYSHLTGTMFVFQTRDIEKGPWKKTELKFADHANSLFFDDDGRVYMVRGGKDLGLTELSLDAGDIKPGGFNHAVMANPAAYAPSANNFVPVEGAQMFKHDNKYYLFCITWPQNGRRTELVFRADRIAGPYAGRALFTDTGIAQGGIIDTPKGDWYATLTQDHGAVGRTPFLIPMTWKDGWPVFETNGNVPNDLPLPPSTGVVPGLVASDDFNRPAPVLTSLKKSPHGENDSFKGAFPLVWQWNHNPDNRYWSLTARPGWLRLTNGRVDASLPDARNLLTQRMFGPDCSGTVVLDVSQMKDGDVAGLAAFQKNYGYVGVKRTGAALSVVMVNAGSGTPTEAATIPLAQRTVYLRVEADFANRADTAFFAYSLDGKTWKPIGDALKMSYTLPHNAGYRFALFNFGTKTAGGVVDFDYFHVSRRETATVSPQ